MPTSSNPTERFSAKVDNYLKYRPHYPPAVIALLQREIGLRPEWSIADIGSGTGFSSELFLANGNTVYGVEPNGPMRAAGENYLAQFGNFVSVNAAAEATTLPDASVDMALAGQAFHWFDQARARAEFERILRGDRWLVLMWNSRDEDNPFQRDYEQLLLEFGTDYTEIRHTNIEDPQIDAFYGPQGCRKARYHNAQVVDLEGLTGRILSSSYVPAPGAPNYEPMLAALAGLFTRHQVDGLLSFDYHTDVYYGRLS
jgi:SAM-dependent methyltransferase